MANAFIELGFNKTLLVNTTGKDIPKNVEEDHVVLIPDADGIGKNVDYGKEVLSQNGAIVEDALRIKGWDEPDVLGLGGQALCDVDPDADSRRVRIKLVEIK